MSKHALSLPQEYSDPIEYFYHLNHRLPASREESANAHKTFYAAVKELFLKSWVTHFDIPEAAVTSLKDPQLDEKWRKAAIATQILENWSNEEAMYEFVQKTLGVDMKMPIMNAYLKFGFDNQIVVSYVYDCLNNIALEWRSSSKYYYPGTAIIQTSGAGKSRSVFAIARSNLAYVVYYTFMEGNGFPKKSKDAPDLLNPKPAHEHFFLWYFGACLAQIARSKDLPADIAAQCIQGPSPFWEGVKHFMTQDEIRKLTLFTDDIDTSFEGWTRKQMKRIVDNWEEKTNGPRDHLRLVFVFDEARATLRGTGETFAKLQELSRYFPKDCGMTVVWIDTVSLVSNIVPMTKSDPSTRTINRGTTLFPPIYLLPTMDLYAKKIKETVTILPDMLQLPTLYQLGRPLWKSMAALHSPGIVCRRNRVIILEDVLRYAMSKLIRGRVLGKAPLSTIECLAILRARLPFKVWRTEIASELVANHMSWCTFMSDDCRYVSSTAVSEPILADAATEWMSSTAYGHSLHILCRYLEMTANGSVDIGKSGEYVAALVCLFARDEALKVHLDQIKESRAMIATSSKSEPSLPDSILHHRMITVKDFFSCLVGESITNKLLKDGKFKSLAQGGISFSHFSHVNITPTREQMMYLMARGTAILCKEMQRGVDLIIPILVPNTQGKYVFSRGNMTYILIQVKNHRRKISDNQNEILAGSMQWNQVGLEETSYPYITINMNVGEQEPFAAIIETLQDKQVAIVLSGIHEALFPCLRDYTSASLDEKDAKFVQDFTEDDDDGLLLDSRESEMLPTEAATFSMTRLSNITEKTSSKLVSILRALLGRSMDPASLYKKHSKEQDHVRSICVPFYLEQCVASIKEEKSVQQESVRTASHEKSVRAAKPLRAVPSRKKSKTK